MYLHNRGVKATYISYILPQHYFLQETDSSETVTMECSQYYLLHPMALLYHYEIIVYIVEILQGFF